MKVIDYTFENVLNFKLNVLLFIPFLKNDRSLFPENCVPFSLFHH